MIPRPHQIRWFCGKHFQIGVLCVVFVFFIISVYYYNIWMPVWKKPHQQRERIFFSRQPEIMSKIRHYYYPTEKRDHGQTAADVTKLEVFARRLERVNDVCTANPELSGAVRGVYTHSSGVIYCFVPKTGCTFWKRIFNFASLKNNDTILTPWDIPRYIVHHNARRNGYRYNPTKHSSANYPMRFLVSRNPFSRILSSYLDKFYLPDFWKPFGIRFHINTSKWSKMMMKPDFLTRHNDLIASLFEKNVTGAERHICGKRLTFPEFIQSAINFPEPHWMPIHKMCNPCSFKPTHVIQMESFMSDSRVILKKMGFEQFLDGFSHDEQVDEEIRTIVDYNFHLYFGGRTKPYIKNCLTSRELAYRLWHNFLWRGYIHPDVRYVIPDYDGKHVKKDLLEQLWMSRRKGLRDKAAMAQAALKFQRDLFSTLDTSLFNDLRKAFKMDFTFFDYKDSLSNISSIRYS